MLNFRHATYYRHPIADSRGWAMAGIVLVMGSANEVSLVMILEKIDRVITALHCMRDYSLIPACLLLTNDQHEEII